MGLGRIAISLQSLVQAHDLVRKVCNFSGSCYSSRLRLGIAQCFEALIDLPNYADMPSAPPMPRD